MIVDHNNNRIMIDILTYMTYIDITVTVILEIWPHCYIKEKGSVNLFTRYVMCLL